jgi:hypothetical protein
VAYSTVTKIALSAQFSGRKETAHPEASDVERSPFGFPFSSMREFSRRICLPRSTVHRHRYRYRHLTQSLRFMVRHLQWLPHFLTAEHKQIRVLMAIELLQVLSVQSKARASGATLSPWTSRGFIYSVSMI